MAVSIVGKNNIMIVCHPDDDIIFGYSALIQNPQSWHVICVTNSSNLVRSSEFHYVMSKIGCSHEMWDYPDVWGGSFPENELKERLRLVVAKFDNVLTHNADGEYGHSQHRALSQIVSSIVGKNLYVFGKSNKLLSFDILSAKLELLKKYKSQYDLSTYDWYDQSDEYNTMLSFIVSESFTKTR